MTSLATSRRAGSAELGIAQGRLEVRQFLRSREQVMFTLAFPAIMILVFGSIFKGEIGDGV
jgi:ABC-2 type transport system permease protein